MNKCCWEKNNNNNGASGVKNGAKNGARSSQKSKWKTVGQMQKAEESYLLGHTDVFLHFPKGNVDILRCLKQWM